MRCRLRTVLVSWGFVLISAISCAPPESLQTAEHSGRFQWLEGCWADPSSGTREVWQSAEPEILFGFNVVTRDGALRFFEQLRIMNSADGWVYAAYPKGVGPTEFFLEEAGDQSAVFLNPDHDYPQRIAYSRLENDLIMMISASDGGDARQWTLHRTGC